MNYYIINKGKNPKEAPTKWGQGENETWKHSQQPKQ